MIGKDVVALDANNEIVSGRVETVRVAGDSIELILDGDRPVAFDRVREIRAAE